MKIWLLSRYERVISALMVLLFSCQESLRGKSVCDPLKPSLSSVLVSCLQDLIFVKAFYEDSSREELMG